MTNKEAIEILQGVIKKPNTKDGYLGQAIDTAIKALEKEPCEDCISRQAVIDTTICDGISCNECSFNTCEDGQAGCLLKERVDKLPSVTPQPRWILVSERLPKGKQPILISLLWDNDTPEVRQGNIDDINYWKHYSHITSIAWMPLPEPYRGGESE